VITTDQAAALSAELLTSAGAWYVDPDSDAVRVADMVLRGASFVVPGVGDALTAVADVVSSHSVVLPGPTAPLVVVGAQDRADPVRFAAAAAGLAVHAAQMSKAGGVQTVVDYLGSSELRAVRSAHAGIATAYVRHLLTGEALTLDGVSAEVSARALLPLDPMDVTLARGIVASALAAVDDHLAPPIRAAIGALRWLRANAPEAIAAPGWAQ
jgi:hypothetical protein